MNAVLWLTAGVLVKGSIGGPPPPAPAPAPDSSKGGSSGKRYLLRKQALLRTIELLRKQTEDEKAAGFVLSEAQAEKRSLLHRAALSDIHAVKEQVQAALVKKDTIQQQEDDEAVCNSLYTAAMLEWEEGTDAYCAHHAERLAPMVMEEEEHNLSTGLIRLSEEDTEQEDYAETLLAETERAARMREIELELELYSSRHEIEAVITHHRDRLKAAQVVKDVPSIMQRINLLFEGM